MKKSVLFLFTFLFCFTGESYAEVVGFSSNYDLLRELRIHSGRRPDATIGVHQIREAIALQQTETPANLVKARELAEKAACRLYNSVKGEARCFWLNPLLTYAKPSDIIDQCAKAGFTMIFVKVNLSDIDNRYRTWVEKSHERNMEFHAWIDLPDDNPQVQAKTAETSNTSPIISKLLFDGIIDGIHLTFDHQQKNTFIDKRIKDIFYKINREKPWMKLSLLYSESKTKKLTLNHWVAEGFLNFVCIDLTGKTITEVAPLTKKTVHTCKGKLPIYTRFTIGSYERHSALASAVVSTRKAGADGWGITAPVSIIKKWTPMFQIGLSRKSGGCPHIAPPARIELSDGVKGFEPELVYRAGTSIFIQVRTAENAPVFSGISELQSDVFIENTSGKSIMHLGTVKGGEKLVDSIILPIGDFRVALHGTMKANNGETLTFSTHSKIIRILSQSILIEEKTVKNSF